MKNNMLVMSGGNNSLKLCMADSLIKWFDSLKEDNRNNEFVSRLYKKYVRFEDLEKTEEALFAVRNTSDISKTLYENYLECREDALLFLKSWSKYFPIHIRILDRPYFYVNRVGQNISLEDVDNLEGDPLWMRPEYMLEKYGGK